ncbi:MAG TPA: hypothetical protein VHE35_23100 [Kofleriaceae bacterium]|nr:hypothetical protein [Kofleriaceae bacterium]
MLRTRSFALGAAALLALAACGKKSDKDKAAGPAPTAPAPTAPPATTPPPPPPPPPPAAYSPDAAKQLIGKLGGSDCAVSDDCEAYKTLVGFGPKAEPDLLAALSDPAVSNDGKRMAAEALGAMKAADAGPKLVELGMASDDVVVESDLFKAAGECGGKPTFDALIAAYAKAIASTDDDHDVPLRDGLRAFPADSVAWAMDQLSKVKKGTDATGYADLVTDSASAADLPGIVDALGKSKDVMVRDRLAAKAIELGDTAHFDVFVAGLSSKDEYDRSDAANFLAEVADKAPADVKPKLVDLLQKGKAADQGGLTAQGYDEALKKLQ